VITLIYTAHEPHELTPEIGKIIRDSDIFIAEGATSPHTYKKLQQKLDELSQGKIAPDEVMADFPSPFWKFYARLFEILYNSRTKILIEKDVVNDEIRKNDAPLDEATDYFKKGNLPEALTRFREYIETETKLFDEKDRIFADSLIQMQKSHKEQDITTLRGGGHTLLYHFIKKTEMRTRRIYCISPYVFPLITEVERMHSFSKPVDDLLLLQTLASLHIAIPYVKIGYTLHAASLKAGRSAARLTSEEIEKFSKHIAANYWEDLGENIFSEVIREWLEEKGIF
jgi:hypothetical protein